MSNDKPVSLSWPLYSSAFVILPYFVLQLCGAFLPLVYTFLSLNTNLQWTHGSKSLLWLPGPTWPNISKKALVSIITVFWVLALGWCHPFSYYFLSISALSGQCYGLVDGCLDPTISDMIQTFIISQTKDTRHDTDTRNKLLSEMPVLFA